MRIRDAIRLGVALGVLYPSMAAGVRGTPALVKDIDRITLSSDPDGLTSIGGTVFFAATEPTTGRELWRSNGTATGTVLVKDITPGTGDSLAPFFMASAATVKGKGTNLPMPVLPLAKDPKVIVHLGNLASACWMADFSSVLANTPTRFRAKSD